MDASLKRHGITLQKDSPSYRRLGYAMLQAAVRANDALRERQHGNIVDTPSPSTVNIAKPQRRRDGPGVSLADVLEKWAAERTPRSKTKTEWSAIVRDFSKLTGSVPAGDIEKSNVLAYKDSMVAAGRAPRTIKKNLAALHSLLAYAVDNDLAAQNVAASVRVKATKSKTREHIPVEDLQRLFSGDVFTQGDRPRGGAGEAGFWLPLLSLFSGARLEELGQLLLRDVKRSPDGIDYIEVTDQGEGQKLKTKGSRRSVPIHPTLVSLGFLRYVESRRASSDARVFPLLRSQAANGKWTDAWSKWWGRYRRSEGVGGRWRDFHALRHTFKRQCRECGIPKDIHDAITGHPSGDVADHYGGAYPLRPLADAMQRLRYDGLDLSEVKADLHKSHKNGGSSNDERFTSRGRE